MSKCWSNIFIFVSGIISTFVCNASGGDILALTPFGSRSVRSVFSVLSQGLLEKGHRVTLVSSGEPILRHENFTHILSPHSCLDEINMFEVRTNSALLFKIFSKAFPSVAREMYDNPTIMNLWKTRNKFDVIIINSAANEMAFPFLQNLEIPFVTLSPAGAEPIQLSYLGNIISPAAMPSILLPFHDRMTFLERLKNTLALLSLRYSYKLTVGRSLNAALSEKFEILEEPSEVYPRQALALFNRHHLLDGAIPLLPNQVEIGCLHCHPPNPLPKDMAEWLSDPGPNGVVFFSLGSWQQTCRVPEDYLNIILEAFKRLPYKIIMKYEIKNDRKFPPNVKTFEWLPQQDILGHDSVVAFISHCGKGSAFEAIYHRVPLVGLPIAFDHPRTCARMSKNGQAISLVWEELTPQILVDSVINITTDKRYQKQVDSVSKRLRSQPKTGLEVSIWWLEYIMEHNNDHIAFSGSDLSLSQYLLLDVLIVLTVVLIIIVLLIVKFVKFICRFIRPRHVQKEKQM